MKAEVAGQDPFTGVRFVDRDEGACAVDFGYKSDPIFAGVRVIVVFIIYKYAEVRRGR